MLSKIKRLILGDRRPINREVDHPVFGKLVYSEDDEAWFTDPAHNEMGFRLFLGGEWVSDSETLSLAPGLMRWAADIVEHPRVFH